MERNRLRPCRSMGAPSSTYLPFSQASHRTRAPAMTKGAGLSETGVSGDLSDGTQSVNGGRTGANGFTVNGGDTQEGVHNGAAVIPNLDSIAEFRIITNNFNAEYGNYSGGQINLVTKSGTNSFHGERLRLSAQHGPGCEELLFPNSRRLHSKPVWRNRGWSYKEKQDVLFWRLPGNQTNDRANAEFRRAYRG